MVEFLYGLIKMPALYIGDFQVQLQTVKNTSPALHVMNSSGDVLYADAMLGDCSGAIKVSDGKNIYSIGMKKLVHEITSINSCENIVLTPGCYYVEVRGGRGGDGGNNYGNGVDAITQTYSFSITADTNITVFRGGDGNSGDFGTNDGISTGGSGGASGVPSLFTMNDIVVKSEGGAGGIGASAIDANGVAQNCGGGGGGNANDLSNGLNGYADSSLNNSFFICGGGGGGAPSGRGGQEASSGLYRGAAGENGSLSNAGKGGDAHRLLSEHTGGNGGETISFSCGGQLLYSYGGGGSGAIEAKAMNSINMDGYRGASGSTGSSSTSFVRIFKFGL